MRQEHIKVMLDPLEWYKKHKLAQIIVTEDHISGTKSYAWEGSKSWLVPVSWFYTRDVESCPFDLILIFSDLSCGVSYYARNDTSIGFLLPLYYRFVRRGQWLLWRAWYKIARFANRIGIMYTYEGAVPTLKDLFHKKQRRDKLENFELSGQEHEELRHIIDQVLEQQEDRCQPK